MLKNIELLRFVFTLMIVTAHLPILLNMFPNYMPLSNRFYDGVLGVDFFFILSGFFFMYTNSFKRSFSDFIVRKIKRLWPVSTFILLLFFLFFYWGLPGIGMAQQASDYIYPLFFLNNLGLTFVHMGVFWYISVLFMVLLFYFALFNVMKPAPALLITGLLSFFGYVSLVNATNGKIYLITELIYPFLNAGLLRGLSGIGLGILLCAAYTRYKPKIDQMKPSFFWTLSEIFVLSGCVYFLIIHPVSLSSHFIFIGIFVGLIGLFLMKKGKISQWADNGLMPVFGRYCYAIFLSHLLVFNLFLCTIWTPNNSFILEHLGLSLLFLYECVIILGVLIYHLIEKPTNRWVKRYGYKRYYMGVLILTAILVSVPIGILQNKSLHYGDVYSFAAPQINVPVYGLTALNWKGALSAPTGMRLQFKKEPGNLKAGFFMMPSVNENQVIIVFINHQPVARWVFQKGEKLYEREIILPPAEKVDIFFQLENPRVPMHLMKMQLTSVRAE